MGSKPERGAYGNKRGKELKRRRRTNHLANPRVAAALAEARQQNQLIDAIAEAQSTGTGRPTLKYVKPQLVPEQRGIRKLTISWNVTDAYRLLRAGYQPAYVAKRTGYSLEIINGLEE